MSTHTDQSNPATDIIDDSTFPVMTIQRQSMMEVLNLDPDTGSWLIGLERQPLDGSHTPRMAASKMFLLRNERVGSALGAFADRIHCWYPVLSFEFPTNFSSFLSGHVSSPVDTCLALLALAIGSLAEKSNIAEALHERPDAPYFDEAAGMLQDILCDYTLGGLQCLILFSIYFMCRLKPCQAHDYILMASFKAQNMLKSRTFSDDNSRSESLQRAYWAVLLIESELAVQLDLAESGIWKYDDNVPLPAGDHIWQHPRETNLSPDSGMDHLSPQDSTDLTRSYFMAEIAMRRMLQRCTTSVSKSAGGRLRYAPLIAAELELQLNEWYDYLPPLLRFQKSPSKVNELAILPTTLFLQTQYSACKISIFWPAIYQAIETGTANDELLHYCEKFLDEYMSFVLAASASLKSCLPNAWTLAARYYVKILFFYEYGMVVDWLFSLFIISMAAIRALSVDCIRKLRHEQLYHYIHAALEAVGEVAPFSPSLMALHGIFRNAVDSISSSPG